MYQCQFNIYYYYKVIITAFNIGVTEDLRRFFD